MTKPTKRDTMAYQHLGSAERYEIAVYRQQGLGVTAIGRKIGRSPSTISRECKRNTQPCGDYDAQRASEAARERRRMASAQPRKVSEAMRREIRRRLAMDHTPEMIAGCCAAEEITMVSSEWIYQLIYRDKRQGGALWTHLPQRHKQRRKRINGRSRRGVIPDRVSIHARPAIVEERSRIGDFEVDTIIGKGRTNGVVTVVDRTSRYVRIARIDRVASEETAAAIIALLRGHPVETITADNGKEFAQHQRVARQLKAAFYFADPYRASQRGTNEQTNGLIRRYFPKGTDFTTVSDGRIEAVEHKLNNRPRKVLGWKTPWQVYTGKAPPPLALQT